MDLPDWISIITTILALAFLGWDIFQLSAGIKEKERRMSQVKIWHQLSYGITNALFRISSDADNEKFSSVKDIKNAVWAVHSTISSFAQSLYEERVMTEDEYKDEEKKMRKEVHEQFINQSKNNPEHTEVNI